MYLFNKENIWSNPQQFPASCIHSNNNSVDRIISKEEEREDPRRDSSIYLRVQIQWCFHIQSIPTRITKIFEYSAFYSVSTRNPVVLHTELILLQELQGFRTSLQHSKAIQHKQASSNSTRQKQHSRRQAASTQSLQ